MLHAKFQVNIPRGSGEVDFVSFAVFNNGGYLGSSIWLNLTFLKSCSHAMILVKFENHGSGGFREDV